MLLAVIVRVDTGTNDFERQIYVGTRITIYKSVNAATYIKATMTETTLRMRISQWRWATRGDMSSITDGTRRQWWRTPCR